MARLARVIVVVSLLGALAAAPAPALADGDVSTNWAGWAVHQPGTNFHSIQAFWVEPTAACVPGQATYSAIWVGLGGYSINSPALEQIGTEVDCSAKGRPIQGAWYEMVPAASQDIRFTVHAGDSIGAAVAVTGHRARLALVDFTRHRRFDRTFSSRNIDVSAAEWIVEAPSECDTDTSCVDLPLAPFTPVRFTGASVQTTSGHVGTISDPSWASTEISLRPDGGPATMHNGNVLGAADPSPLGPDGSSFAVTFTRSPAPSGLFGAIRHLR